MRQFGIVREVRTECAIVEVSRESACEMCHAKTEGGCSGCVSFGSSKKLEARAENSLGAVVGDRVEHETPSNTVILYAAGVFLFPLICGIIGYFLGGLFAQAEIVPYLCALAGFIGAFAVVYFTLNKTASKRLDVRITRILS